MGTEGELDELLGEIGGPCNYDNMVKMFQEKMAGEGNDSDDLIVQAFKAYDFEGKIDSKMFTHALMTWGDKMTKAEIDDIFGEFEIDEDYMIKTKDVISLLVSSRKNPRLRNHLQLRRLLWRRKRMLMLRRRRRRRRRLPSKLIRISLLYNGCAFWGALLLNFNIPDKN